jgi:hypothetical protein
MKIHKKVCCLKRCAVCTLFFSTLIVLILFVSFAIACDLHAIRSILQANRNLLNGKMFGYEGSDVYGIIQNVRDPSRQYLFVTFLSFSFLKVENEKVLFIYWTRERRLLLSSTCCY